MMSRNEYLKYAEETYAKMLEITKRKNADYTGGSDSDDAFFNFKIGEMLQIGTVEQGFLFRITDKISRIIGLTVKGNKAQVLDEAVEDTLLDLSNYCVLFAGYLRSKKEVSQMSTINWTFNLSEEDDRNEHKVATKGPDFLLALSETANMVFRPARKHGYPKGKIQEFLDKFPDGEGEELIGLLEDSFFEILNEHGIDLRSETGQ